VRVDALGLEARATGEAPQDQEGAGAGEAAALRVEEELRAVPLVEVGAPVGEVAPERLDRVPADRDDALLVALAGAADEPSLEVDAGTVETDGFAHAEARAVEQFDQRPVAHHPGRRARGGLDQALGLRGRERAWELAPPTRKLERGGRAVGAQRRAGQSAEERAARPPRAGDRRGGEAGARAPRASARGSSCVAFDGGPPSQSPSARRSRR
jgi:hypothetical protein